MDLTISLTFTETGSGALLHGEFDPKPKGIIALLFPVLRPMIRLAWRNNIRTSTRSAKRRRDLPACSSRCDDGGRPFAPFRHPARCDDADHLTVVLAEAPDLDIVLRDARAARVTAA